MGYYTDFTLELSDESKKAEVYEELFKLNDYVGEYLPCGNFNTKWYDYKEDMLELSRLFPDIMFTLTGIGEEPDDYWKTYFKDGKSQRVKGVITYKPFNEKEMK